ncbi:MAG: hypothetical protein K6E34_02005 [Lachnospiraceae bacterium]|nr:hypothetical protein [Lachnospiraceae bacterium]
MIELSRERIEQILHEETVKKEDLDTILRGIYFRYMRLYERYFADLDALDDDMIAKLRDYHEETKSLVKYYYLDIPQDICEWIVEFDKEYTDNMLGPGWRDFLSDAYKQIKKENLNKHQSEEDFKTDFAKDALTTFYDVMDYIFRDGFGTGSKTTENTIDGLAGLLFGK